MGAKMSWLPEITYIRCAFEMQHDSTNEGALITNAYNLSPENFWNQERNDALYLALAGSFGLIHSTDVLYKSLQTTWNLGAEGVVQFTSFGTEIGTRVPGGTQVQSVAYLLSKVSERIGRKNRGRIFVPYVDDADIQGIGGDLNNQGVFALQAVADSLNGVAFSGSLGLQSQAILHAQVGLAPTGFNFVPRSHLGTQRRRINRRS
jgi:hypothetical protein